MGVPGIWRALSSVTQLRKCIPDCNEQRFTDDGLMIETGDFFFHQKGFVNYFFPESV